MSLPDYILQEVRNLLALHCREICMVEKAGGEKASKQEHEHYMSFHGTESHMSVLDLFLKGTGLCEGVFDRTDIENNRPGNNFRASVGYMLELKEHFHCASNGHFILHDPGFTRADIAIQRGNPITGRILHDKALVVIANYKHALKHYKAFMDDDDNYPSGTGFEDVLLDVRQKMCVEFKGCRNKPTGVAGRNRPSVDAENMPATYMWHGYYVFIVFGPKPLSGETFGCFSVDGYGVKKRSRNQIREEAAKKKQAEQMAGTGGFVPEAYCRGVSITAKATAAKIAQAEYSDHVKALREILTGLTMDSMHTLEEYKMVCAQLQEAREGCNAGEEEKLVRWKESLETDLVDIRKRKREYESELRDHLSKKPAQLKAFYDQVGEFEDGTLSTRTGSSSSSRSSRPREVRVSNHDHDGATSVLDDDHSRDDNNNNGEDDDDDEGN